LYGSAHPPDKVRQALTRLYPSTVLTSTVVPFSFEGITATTIGAITGRCAATISLRSPGNGATVIKADKSVYFLMIAVVAIDATVIIGATFVNAGKSA